MSDRVQHPVFTKEMRKTHTILFPDMLPIHFRLLKEILNASGYKAELLVNEGADFAKTGVKYVHNDMCYPAIITIGQMIQTLQSGKYDTHKVALALTQTGGGCRASNYIFLLRKALRDAGLEYVPVISLNLSGMEKQPGFTLTIPLLRKMLAAMAYGDMLMLLGNQTRPYETVKGSTDDLIQSWIAKLSDQFSQGKGYSLRHVRKQYGQIAQDFHELPVIRTKKVKTGIVGEIYVKYSSAANNHLEAFLASQDCEVMVPGILAFLLYAVDMPMEDTRRYGGSRSMQALTAVMLSYLTMYETYLAQALKPYPEYTKPASYAHLKELVKPYLSTGCKMGEGWLLCAEMLELTESGYGNIVCAQPFGCLPNHIAGKAMIGKIRAAHKDANIVAIDYDPGAAKVNQENRIKLMLSIARERI
jgi:predicted nucleotide-binding protein (sugar kinase/HSP70/actin superfamily)